MPGSKRLGRSESSLQVLFLSKDVNLCVTEGTATQYE